MGDVFAGASPSQLALTLPDAVSQTTTSAKSDAPAEAVPLSKKEIRQAARKHRGERSWLVTLLLVIFLGPLGIHRFYLGYPFWGLVFLFTGGLFGIGWILDIIRVLISNLKPKGGSYRY